MGDSMERREALEKLYEKAFHPDVYNKTYYGRLDEEVKFFMHNLHDFFSKSKIDSSKQSCLTGNFKRCDFCFNWIHELVNWKNRTIFPFHGSIHLNFLVRDSCEKRVLEIGTGPTVISMISASSNFRSLELSKLSELTLILTYRLVFEHIGQWFSQVQSRTN